MIIVDKDKHQDLLTRLGSSYKSLYTSVLAKPVKYRSEGLPKGRMHDSITKLVKIENAHNLRMNISAIEGVLKELKRLKEKV